MKDKRLKEKFNLKKFKEKRKLCDSEYSNFWHLNHDSRNMSLDHEIQIYIKTLQEDVKYLQSVIIEMRKEKSE